MSLRLRVPAPAEPPALAWSETVSALAEVHRARRAADETSRWPLAHACTGGGRAVGRAPDGHAAGRQAVGQPFCCRALA